LEAGLRFRSERVLLLVKEERKTLFPGLLSMVTFAEPFADLGKCSVVDVLMYEVTMYSGNRKHVHLPLVEQWNSGRVEKSIYHIDSTAGVFNANTGIASETNVSPSI
jgi:hypothetical protein